MSGHSHWAGIKHKKEITDQKRAKVFSKLLALISAAAKAEPNPDFNPRLRTAIATAKEMSVPQDNIDRAVKKASEAGNNLEELTFEAYGPGGIAILIEAVSDNKNRAVQEIKTILKERNGKWAETGSVQWAFEKTPSGWTAKFPQGIPEADTEKLLALIEALHENDNVQDVYTNAASLPVDE
jgi:YebC/PmpR family DNA-binding regulatory protein